MEKKLLLLEPHTPTNARVMPSEKRGRVKFTLSKDLAHGNGFSAVNPTQGRKVRLLELNSQLRTSSRAGRLARLVVLSRSTKEGHGRLFHSVPSGSPSVMAATIPTMSSRG